jgi:hypothetical protein
LPLIALAGSRRRAAGLVIGGGLFLLVGIAGYALLANQCYNVPWLKIPAWAAGHSNRPETVLAQWGTLQNLTVPALGVTALNHAFYSVLIPGVTATRGAGFLSTPAAVTALVIYILAVIGALLLCIVKSSHDRLVFCSLAAAAIWIVTRVIFYCWWNPNDPFLFAVLSLPALWLILIMAISRRSAAALLPTAGGSWETIALTLLTLTVWTHNAINLIQPFRNL